MKLGLVGGAGLALPLGTLQTSGQRLFADGIAEMVLELVDTQTFGSGVVVLTYRPAREGAEG